MTGRKLISRKKAAVRPLVITRIFDAPRRLVFEAWTNAPQLKRWSAPNGFTIPSSKGDVRPGGPWRARMRSPDGDEYQLSGIYRQVIPDELLVFTHAWEEDGERGHETLVTVRFAAHRGKTKQIFRQSGFASTASRQGHKGGWTECFDRLASHLAKRRASAAD